MIRLGVSVEGATEREFVSLVLRPHLEAMDIHPIGVDLGGNVGLDRVEREVRRLLGDFDVVTTLYDFYGFKDRGARPVDVLEDAMAARMPEGHRRFFIPYVQQFEFEALVLAVPAAVEARLRVPGLAAELSGLCTACGGPEAVNDGYDTCPSRRLQRVAPGYDKKLHGPEILRAAGLATIRGAAPRFHRWLERLEALEGPGGGAG